MARSLADRRADELAKDLYPYLVQHIHHPELKALGWFDFVNVTRPKTSDPVVMALEAFVELFLDPDGNWIQHVGGLSAILAFLRDKTGRSPSIQQADALKGIICATPVDQAAFEDWLYAVFP